MESKISGLLAEIRKLELELEDALKTHEVEFLYRIDGTKVRFEKAVRETHKTLRISILRWLRTSSLRNILSSPFIYSMIVPFLILDAFISVYQAICFPLYRIQKVERRKYIVIDRHRLSYLNLIEKFNCVYCGYANGLLGYCREIGARTEEYWCPIKHATRILNPQHRYARFADFGDPYAYQAKLAEVRTSAGKADM